MTDQRHVQGVTLQNGVDQFLGLRYAAPPLGDLRFRAPKKPLTEQGVVDATSVSLTQPLLSFLCRGHSAGDSTLSTVAVSRLLTLLTFILPARPRLPSGKAAVHSPRCRFRRLSLPRCLRTYCSPVVKTSCHALDSRRSIHK